MQEKRQCLAARRAVLFKMLAGYNDWNDHQIKVARIIHFSVLYLSSVPNSRASVQRGLCGCALIRC